MDQYRIFANHLFDKGLVSRIYKESSRLSCKKTNNLSIKWQKKRYFIKEDRWQVYENMFNTISH